MNRQELLNGFDFDNEGVFDHEIDDKALCDLYSFVLEREGDPAMISDFSKFQLAAQASVITGFQETRAQMPMYLDCCPDGFFADWIGGMLDESHGPSRKAAA